MVAINPSIALQVENPQIPRVMNTAAQAVGVGNAMRQEDRAATAFGMEKEQAEYDTALSRSKEGLRFVRTPEEYISWSDSNFQDPILGGILTKMGVTPEKSRAQIQAEIGKPGGLERLIQQSAAGIDQLPSIMGNRSNQLVKQQETAAANARTAQQQAVLQGIISGQPMPQGGAPNALMPTGAGRTAPVNALTAPAPQATGMRPPPPGVTNVAPLEGMTVSGAPPTGSLVTPATMQPSGAPAASREDELRSKIIQLRNLAATNYPGASAAADQLQKTLDLVSPGSKAAPPASIQEYNLARQQGYQGSFQDFKTESATKQSLFEPEYSKIVGKSAGERDTKMFEAASAATDNLVKLNDTLNQIESSDAITGFGADVLKNIERVRAQFTADKKAGKRVADTEILDAMLGSDVFSMIQSLGIGARGLDTPNEREFLRQVMTGTISMDKKALVKLTEIRKNISERAVDKYNKQVDEGKFDRFFEVQGIAPQKIEKPTLDRRSTTNNMSLENKQALDWANSNPNDPRSAQIKSRLGM